MKSVVFFIFLFPCFSAFTQPANDNCSNAINMVVDAGLSCGQTTLNATLEGSECFTNYSGGSTEVSTWYSFTATDDSTVLNFVQTNSSNCFPHISVYGPFASATCQPLCATAIYSALSSGDPGAHILLTSLTVGQVYMVQVQGNECGGPNDGETDFCIGVAEASPNGQSTGATLIDECGTAFNETTDGGYWQSGTGSGFANLDNNATTQCGTCAAGLDVPFVINNAAWNTFCALTNGTWQITVDNITNCALTGAGVQAAVFTGTTGNLALQGSQSPVAGTWSSPVITVNAGECAFLMIDGFAGDVCDYSVTLTNITGGCTILPIELVSFDVNGSSEGTEFNWAVKSELETVGYRIEESYDGYNFEKLGFKQSFNNALSETRYSLRTKKTNANYFRIVQLKTDGTERILAVKYFKKNVSTEMTVNVYPNPVENNINVEIQNNSNNLPVEFELLNFQNQTIWSKKAETSNTFSFDFSGIQSGQYLLRIRQGEKINVERITID